MNKRISELEKMLSTIIAPLQDVRKVTQNYMRLIGILIDRGGLTPDMTLPDLKDSISKDIVRALLEKPIKIFHKSKSWSAVKEVLLQEE